MKKIKTLTVGGQQYALGYLDDTTVGTGGWSAKKLVDTLCPAFTHTGTEITCYPVAGYPLEIISQPQPVQTGTPDPAQPCPITGRNSLTFSHNGQAFAAQLGETVYGGSYNWQTGELTVTWKLVSFDGTEIWSVYHSSSKITTGFTMNLPDKTVGYNTSICSHFRNTKNQEAHQSSNMAPGKYSDHASLQRVYFDWGDPTENQNQAAGAVALANFKAWLKAQFDAGNPVQLCYKLAEPITVQIQPQQVLAAAGENVLTAVDSMTVSGRWDLPKFLEGVMA